MPRTTTVENFEKQERMPLIEALENFRKQEPAYFRIPAHRFARGLNAALTGRDLAELDLSEAEGLDDLHHAEGAIKEAQALACELFRAKQTWFLVNGTTCGNEAMVLSAVGEGEKIILPRNVHKSVLMGLIMSGAVPVYVTPEYLPQWKLWGSVTPEAVREAFEREPDCKAVFLVSPTYYGITSSLREIAEICHAHQAVLLVDEAHGAHTYFSEELPKGALTEGADAVCQSFHKTAGSFTQSSLLHLCSDRLSPQRIQENLHLVQSTSPSYLLMASLDAARRELAVNGTAMMAKAVRLAKKAREELKKIPGIAVLEKTEESEAMYEQDLTRLVFSASALGLSGHRLAELLYERDKISLELTDEHNVVAVITFANEESEIDRLVEAVRRLQAEIGGVFREKQQPKRNVLEEKQQPERNTSEEKQQPKRNVLEEKQQPERNTSEEKQQPKRNVSEETVWKERFRLPQMAVTPRAAYFAQAWETLPLEEAEGRAVKEMVVPYPPGIPLLCPGELLTKEYIQEIRRLSSTGCVFHGPADGTMRTIRVLKTARDVCPVKA